ncbi:Protein of unknown function DUF2283 [Thermodesulfatator indicus DSM 15286]|uniref:DUF2283 domain-containing protein n=1 Tax=Thermodesulfatator indicus (strain DSM 15286 / JCM 11887 / CIR29812) TaxID=667014 RepID=F8ABL5_THEID|nr:DUF2283 domain-containing protein [Thermodesulfatator indicus]AEH45615.1 Protein of unknown function DUF2283 [Thermodesulfatator indicus DSM 15286]
MKIIYYSEDDIIYIDLQDKPSMESEEVSPGIVIDFDENGVPVGIEISNASQKVRFKDLEIINLPISDFIFKKAA